MQLAIPAGDNTSGDRERECTVAQGLHRAHDSDQRPRCHGAQRDSADRRVFAVLRHRHGRARRAQPNRDRSARCASSHIMLKVTGYVMFFAPLAVFGALASTVAKEGLGIIGVYGCSSASSISALLVLWIVLICLGGLIIGPRVLRLMRRVREPVILRSPLRAPKRRIRRRSKSSNVSAAATASPASCCRWAILQSRRLDDVLHVRRDVHRAGVRHRAAARAADPWWRC